MNQRKNAGRKSLPESKKKRQISVYLESETIDRFGGMDAIKRFIIAQISEGAK
jgi:hypothetical protein